jgi:hypothetical protein
MATEAQLTKKINYSNNMFQKMGVAGTATAQPAPTVAGQDMGFLVHLATDQGTWDVFPARIQRYTISGAPLQTAQEEVYEVADDGSRREAGVHSEYKEAFDSVLDTVYRRAREEASGAAPSPTAVSDDDAA